MSDRQNIEAGTNLVGGGDGTDVFINFSWDKEGPENNFNLRAGTNIPTPTNFTSRIPETVVNMRWVQDLIGPLHRNLAGQDWVSERILEFLDENGNLTLPDDWDEHLVTHEFVNANFLPIHWQPDQNTWARRDWVSEHFKPIDWYPDIPPGMVTSPTPPIGAEEGQLWWDQTAGGAYARIGNHWVGL